MIDPSFVGYELPPHTEPVEQGRLRFFAQAIGETSPIYRDEAAARAAGFRSLPAPPTFLFCLDMDIPEQYAYLEEMGVPLGKVLHGEQSFRYYSQVCAGDLLTFRSRIANIYAKKGGDLEFIVRDTAVTREGLPVADLRSTIVVRHGSTS